jgi:hypothetical protein
MMTEQQIIDFAESSAFAVFDGEGTEADHRENIRDTLNDERASEHENAAFTAFDVKLSALRGVSANPVIVKATADSMRRDARRWAAGVAVDPRRPYDAKLARLDASLAAHAA